MEKIGFSEEVKFKSPQEELSFLREQIAQKEKEMEMEQGGATPDRHTIVSEHIEQYKKQIPEQVLHKDAVLSTSQVEGIVLNLSPETHDKKMEELLVILQGKGIKNVLSVVSALKDPHIDDDFHRFLVQFIKKGMPVKGLKPKNSLFKALNMTLYEVVLPNEKGDEREKPLKELISGMEQFYAGMLSVSSDKKSSQNYFVIEIANANHSDEFIFYASIPNSKKELFEKHVLAIFHNAKITGKDDDYNIFNEEGVAVGSYATSGNNPIFPLKTYEAFDTDPLNAILNSFSKIDKDGEGASIQLVINPAGDYHLKRYKYALTQILKGVKLKKAINMPESFLGGMLKTLQDVFGGGEGGHKKDGFKEPPRIDDVAVENIKNKLSSPIVTSNIRIIASAGTEPEAEEILANIESSFNQFENTQGNSLKFKRVKKGALRTFLHNFSYRIFSRDEKLPLSLKELTSLVHFHTTALKGGSAQLKQSKAGDASVPLGIPTVGTLLGVNNHRGATTKIYMSPEDRLRHFYTIGQTGTGKSTLLKNMIIQDIQSGNGVCMIDPHGIDILDVLANIPEERLGDVIYFDPSYVERPMGLNMLEYDRRYPEQKTFVVNELFSIFQKLYGAVPESMGPMFEQYFRNATMLVIEDSDSGSTLLDVSRVLSNKDFRELKLSKCNNPVVVQFWREVAEKAGGEGALANIVPYITSKFDVFLANDIMRPIIAQQKSALNFREIMDNRKILLVNLSKGRLGDINANLIGLILVGKILMASLSRVDMVGGNIAPFYLYIDEFQNVTTDSIATILSEARKYKLGLNIAHQFIAQLEDNIKDAVFGNVGSIASFRVGAEDAEYLEKQFDPVFTASDLMNLDNRNAYVKLLVDGRPLTPFNIETLAPPTGNPQNIEQVKQLSYIKYGNDRAIVEAEIMKKYQKAPVASPPIPPATV
ncbi:MAG: hypothetical protein HQ402_02945 [Parcubacteria group bacterium]|nr:hypothetical protein [Parcubacteria group bacterium]